MTRENAESLWGAGAVALALAASITTLDPDLLAKVELAESKYNDAGFAAWATRLPWPQFCAVVRLVAGETRRWLEAS
jgi:hypothetical protein